jgi:membrane-bound lytic murein transglycosylase B
MTRVTQVPWRRVAAALPAVALVGTGAALATTGGHSPTTIVADSRPLVTVPDTALHRLEAPVLPPLPELPAPTEAEPTHLFAPSGQPASMSVNGIPAAAHAAYRRAARLVDAADPQCRVDWALVAAIGKVESDHGRYGGNGLDRDGTVRPGIFGIPLDGRNNTAVIADSDGGSLDRDGTWDRAVGPMQFIPGTWRTVGVDANGDGVKDPQNLDDAATAAAVYLCSGPGDLSTPAGARSAVLRYNHSDAYADQVLAIAEGYRNGYTVVPASHLTDAQRTGSPYLPSGDSGTMREDGPVSAAQPAGKPSRPAAQPGKGGSSDTASSGSGGSGTGSGSGSESGSDTPSPTPSPTSGVRLTDTVDGVVDGVVGGLAGGPATPSVPAPAPATPSTTPSPALPLEVLPVDGRCPEGYDPELELGIPVLCVRR